MGSLTALLLATPIFGFSLTPPMVADVMDLSAKTAAEFQSEDAAPDEAQSDEAPSEGRVAKKKHVDDSQAEYVREIKSRNSIASIHRAFGIATWVAMTLTVSAGFMDYYNLYGIGASQGKAPCVRGTAIGGDAGCSALRPVKDTLAYATTALYATTFTLSLLMPDPDNLSEGKGEFASTLRLHKALRWVHLGGMIAQIALGIIIGTAVGPDRANHYGTLQALSTVHMGVGLVTYGALTWAGALMAF